MKKILTYSNRKIDDMIWDVSTHEKEQKAKKALFKILDKDWHMFDFIEKYTTLRVEKVCKSCGNKTIKEEKGEYSLDYLQYKGAKKGDYYDISNLLDFVKNEEYGQWKISELI